MIAMVVGTSRESRGGRGSKVQKVIVKCPEVKKCKASGKMAILIKRISVIPLTTGRRPTRFGRYIQSRECHSTVIYRVLRSTFTFVLFLHP